MLFDKMLFLGFLLLIFSPLVGQKSDKILIEISLEKSSAEYEQGEPINLNVRMKSFFKDSVEVLEPTFINGNVRWEVKKGDENIYGIPYCGPPLFNPNPLFKLGYKEERIFKWVANDIFYYVGEGDYTTQVCFFQFDKEKIRGDSIKSNILKFKVLPVVEEGLWNAWESVVYYRDEKEMIKSGFEFLERFPKSHFTEEVILEIGGAYRQLKQHQKAIHNLKKMYNLHLTPTEGQMRSVYIELGLNYEAIGEFDMALAYFKKLPKEWNTRKNLIARVENRIKEK